MVCIRKSNTRGATVNRSNDSPVPTFHVTTAPPSRRQAYYTGQSLNVTCTTSAVDTDKILFLYFLDNIVRDFELNWSVCSLSLFQTVDFETKRSYTLKVEATNPHIDPRFLAWGPFKDEATIKVK